VHAISPGPLKTRAAGGLKGFDRLLAMPHAWRLSGETLFAGGGVIMMA
jgi:enoyl-[acyl-carrier-protein] reductase (NADH)